MSGLLGYENAFPITDSQLMGYWWVRMGVELNSPRFFRSLGDVHEWENEQEKLSNKIVNDWSYGKFRSWFRPKILPLFDSHRFRSETKGICHPTPLWTGIFMMPNTVYPWTGYMWNSCLLIPSSRLPSDFARLVTATFASLSPPPPVSSPYYPGRTLRILSIWGRGGG